MIKYFVPKDANILFIGINPHPGSYSKGIPFSNNKMFWYILEKSGLISEGIDNIKNDKKLKEIYLSKFSKFYKFGLLNIINRPTKDTTMIKNGEEVKGVLKIREVIKREKPKIVCFIGKITYSKFSGKKNFNFGFQDNLYESKVFVARFPIRGYASIRINEMKNLKKFILG